MDDIVIGDKKDVPQYAVGKNTRAEIIVLIIIIIIVVLLFLFFAFYAIRQLRRSNNDALQIGPPTEGAGCPPADAPSNIMTSPGTTVDSIDISWDAVLTSNTPGNTIQGYYVYISDQPGITADNRGRGEFTITPAIRLNSFSGGRFVVDTTYYARITTFDTCGESLMSDEVSFTIE